MAGTTPSRRSNLPEPDQEALPPAAELLGLEVPPECVPGVIANLAALAGHLANVEGFALPGEA